MGAKALNSRPRPDRSWRQAVAPFEKPCLRRSLGQLANSVLPYIALLVAMHFALQVAWWLALLLAVPAAGFLVRIFIIFHDCGHGSFFRSGIANRVTGFLTGLLVFTPSRTWHRRHAAHHATAGDLDRRGTGDVWTLTVKEYQSLSRPGRLWYRIYRHPVVLLGIGPAWMFFVEHRLWARSDGRAERWSTVRTNLVLAAVAVVACLTIGWKAYLLIALSPMLLAGTAGVWLFYVQHQFEGTYWERHAEWDRVRQAVEGSSFYKLPRVLQWFSGNIGYHHVHHLSSRIPNYNLQACHEAHELFRSVRPVTLRASLRSLGFRLWDEERRRLVGFDGLAA
jgi:omega-6 fatty acid desaturase (delta-12 desaturase)